MSLFTPEDKDISKELANALLGQCRCHSALVAISALTSTAAYLLRETTKSMPPQARAHIIDAVASTLREAASGPLAEEINLGHTGDELARGDGVADQGTAAGSRHSDDASALAPQAPAPSRTEAEGSVEALPSPDTLETTAEILPHDGESVSEIVTQDGTRIRTVDRVVFGPDEFPVILDK